MCQRLTYEEFVQKLRKWIIKDAHLPEDYVFLKKKEKTGITANGDRLFVVCAETDSGKDICGIFVEELYQDYVEGTSMENIEARVKCDLDRAGNMENTRYLNDYEKVREHLFLGLLNLEKHRHELKNTLAMKQTLRKRRRSGNRNEKRNAWSRQKERLCKRAGSL